MKAIEIARKLAAYQQIEDARRAYTLAIQENGGSDPGVEYEAALYLLQTKGDYKISYTCFQKLYNQGHFREELLPLMTHAFYEPNIKLQKTRYEKNCKLLAKYPYLFRRDFLPFDELPIQFFPYDDNGYTPFYKEEDRFGSYVDFNNQIISRSFFKDLEKPVLAEDVYSQYELEYLNDNVRKSEWVGRENHIYLHYSDWGTFCAHLQCLNLRPLLAEKKVVFLIEDEIRQYPIDFQARFGMDYSQYTVKPFGIREINRLIWHTQLAAHNGGDFFNEIFFEHPNLLAMESIMFETVQSVVASMRKKLAKSSGSIKSEWSMELTYSDEGEERSSVVDTKVLDQLLLLKNVTDKDIFVAIFLSDSDVNKNLDRNSRIVPAIFFQPHFSNMLYTMTRSSDNRTVLCSDQYEMVQESSIFRNFKYIKTFSPMRRPTTSYGATVKFMAAQIDEKTGKSKKWDAEGRLVRTNIPDVISQRLLNRSFMIDWQDRLYKDSVLVRFEDGKLNPKATFTALAAFLDIPYTESMTYCSGMGGLNPESMAGNVRGFDTATVYRTYDEYANDAERYFLEYFMRDAYAFYGYDFQYYDGKPVDEEKAKSLIQGFTRLNELIRKTVFWQFRSQLGDVQMEVDGKELTTMEEKDPVAEELANNQMEACNQNRLKIAARLLSGLNFVNKNGQPLHMMPALRLDPDLLEQPLYH